MKQQLGIQKRPITSTRTNYRLSQKQFMNEFRCVKKFRSDFNVKNFQNEQLGSFHTKEK